jgi:hypothetical protein
MLAYFLAVEKELRQKGEEKKKRRLSGWEVKANSVVEEEEEDIFIKIEKFRTGAYKAIEDKEAPKDFSEALTDELLVRLEIADDSDEVPDLIKETGLGPTDGMEWSVWQATQPPLASDACEEAPSSNAGEEAPASEAPASTDPAIVEALKQLLPEGGKDSPQWISRIHRSMMGGNNSGLVDPTQPIVRSDGTYVEDIQGGIVYDMESDDAGSENRSVLGDDSCSEDDGDENESAGSSDSECEL